MQIRLPIYMVVAILLMAVHSCKQKEILVPEQAKDLEGEWHITKAVRNGVDITKLADFTQFRIKFSYGQQYAIANPLPFIVTKNGSYALDDPKYPFRITFTQTGGAPVSSAFTYPVVNGKRTLNFTFSPGCAANTYIYSLERLNP